MIPLSEEQLMQIAVSYQFTDSELSPAEYLQKIAADYTEFYKAYKSLRNAKARTGSKDKLGL